MQSAEEIHPATMIPQPDLRESLRDYETVREIIAFISENWRDQPDLEAIAAHVGLSTTHVHHLFRRWAGLTPKAFFAGCDARCGEALAGCFGQCPRHGPRDRVVRPLAAA